MSDDDIGRMLGHIAQSISAQAVTMEAAAKLYREQARFHYVVQSVVAQEMLEADKALEECERDPHNMRQTVDYLATSVAVRMLATIYENDAELKQLRAEIDRLREIITTSSSLLRPPPITVQTRGSHETYIDAKGCLCRHCGLRWGMGEPEPPGPCVFPRIT